MMPRVNTSAFLFNPIFLLSISSLPARDDLIFLAPHLVFTFLYQLIYCL